MRRVSTRGALVTVLTAVGMLSGGSLTSAVVAESTATQPPMDYIAQRDKLSQPIYPTTIKEIVDLPMADGEKIYLEITRPDPAAYPELGPVPVILEASPYHGANGTRIGDRIYPDPKQGAANLGLVGYFAPRGYAVVMMDLRGTGRSTGCLDHIGPKDASDMKAVIEWAASQPWSNGRVGMTGHSYVGATQTAAAAMRPKGLVTVVPSAGLASMYDHQYAKGVPYNLQWVGPMVAYEWLAVVRDLPPGVNNAPVLGGTSGDNWMRGGPSAQTGCGMQNSSLTAGSGQATGQYELWHAKRDWREGAADADIPIFIIHGVNDNAARIPAAEWFFKDRILRDGDKVWLGQWDHGSTNGSCGNTSNARVSHPNCRFNQWQYALHAWFDHHLMQRTWTDADGVVHQIDTGPPVEVFTNAVDPRDPSFVMDPAKVDGKVFTSDGWRRYPKVTLYPDASNGTLGFAPPAQTGSDTLGPTAGAAAAQVNTGSIEFASAPFEEDAFFLGLPRLNLHASVSNSQITHLIATLYRVHNDEREPMNYCAINPLQRHGIATLSPVVPGEEMTLPMQCFTMAHWVPAGDSLVLQIDTIESRHFASFGSDAQITVFTGPDDSDYLLPSVPEFTLFEDVPLRG